MAISICNTCDDIDRGAHQNLSLIRIDAARQKCYITSGVVFNYSLYHRPTNSYLKQHERGMIEL